MGYAALHPSYITGQFAKREKKKQIGNLSAKRRATP
jgi:hypothetical protein